MKVIQNFAKSLLFTCGGVFQHMARESVDEGPPRVGLFFHPLLGPFALEMVPVFVPS